MSQSQAEFFDSIADQWDSWEGPDIAQRIARVIQLADLQSAMRVLDVGTGTGVLLPGLSSAVGNQGRILAIDVSSGMLRVAAAKGVPDNVEILQVSLEGLPPERSEFDRVMCNAVFPHFSDGAWALAKIHDILKPGGRLVISHPIGREAVNAIHSSSDSIVKEDSVPTSEVMHCLLAEAGFTEIEMLDEPEFHAAIGRRAPPPACADQVEVSGATRGVTPQ